MCRLLGYVARDPMKLCEVLGHDVLAFTDLSRRHTDGWGMARYEESGRLDVRRGLDAAYSSPEYAKACTGLAADAQIVHLRWATLGFPVRLENTHPFTDGRLAFAHNGSIKESARLDERISCARQVNRRGDTDSERYFLLLLSLLSELDPVDALRQAVAIVKERSPDTSLNCLLLTPDTLYALAQHDPEYARNAGEPDYFHLRYLETPGHVVVASSGWPQPGWTPLQNGSLLVVKRSTLETSVLPVKASAAA